MTRFLLSASFIGLLSLALVLGDAQAAGDGSSLKQPEFLTVGSVAPKLDIEHWYGDSSRPTKIDFQPGQVYVVEFWATWCGPCVRGMPHLAELQRKYADQKVTVIGVSDETPDEVEAFLEIPVQGKKDEQQEGKQETYGDLTSVYRLASDSDMSTHKDYMEAALQSGIPTAFLIGKTGQIEWIGHPGRMDDALEQVLDDTWDREAFSVAFKDKQQSEYISGLFYEALDAEDFDKARKLIAELNATPNSPNAKENARYLNSSLEFALVKKAMTTDPVAGTDKLATYYKGLKGNSRSVFFKTTDIIEAASEGELQVSEDQWRILVEACEAELEDAGIDTGILLNTTAHLHHRLGNLDKAVEFHNKAIDNAKSEKSSNVTWFQRDLDALLSEKTKSRETPDANDAEKAG